MDNIKKRFAFYLKKNGRLKRDRSKLTAEMLAEIWDHQKGCCAITGVPLILREPGSKRLLQSASLDRIDSKIGYEPGNLQFLAHTINLGKSDKSNEDILAFYVNLKKLFIAGQTEKKPANKALKKRNVKLVIKNAQNRDNGPADRK